jgi:hypothetical protein
MRSAWKRLHGRPGEERAREFLTLLLAEYWEWWRQVLLLRWRPLLAGPLQCFRVFLLEFFERERPWPSRELDFIERLRHHGHPYAVREQFVAWKVISQFF